MEKGFPFDCKGCEHFFAYDLSVDDWVLGCDVLKQKVDECDAWMYPQVKCPLEQARKE